MDMEVLEGEHRPPTGGHRPPTGGHRPPTGGHRPPAAETYPKRQSFPIYMAALPNGKRTPILKSMFSSACTRNCKYCAFRADRDFRRETFQPDEMAESFVRIHRAGAVQGIFLSSGMMGSGVTTQDKLLDTAEILRHRMGYQDYLHLKIMPGAEKEQVRRAMQLADRVSVNLEAPTTAHLHKLAPQKMLLEELLRPLRWVEEIRLNEPGRYGWKGRWPSSTTQFVVGAVDETDVDLLRASQYLTHQLHLKRVYYSPFNPVPGTPLEHQSALNPWRQSRLYQASFLIRDYGFDLEEFPFAADGNLPLDVDPKLAWAQQNLAERPVDLERADLQHLMRVPGIGPVGAKAILKARRLGRLRGLRDLRRLGVHAERAGPFILIHGRRPAQQLALF
ncbi:MAG: radical SAM protein [Anaerolineaceae bacterium]|nr:radical SAM protein [Anaerolineaceae bacterium]